MLEPVKLLMRIPVSPNSGYGNDGIQFTTALMKAGVDVRLHPTHVSPPLPPSVAYLLTKPLDAPFDIFINHVDPAQIECVPQARAASSITIAHTMWEFGGKGGLNNLKGKSTMRKRLKDFDLLLGYSDTTLEAMQPYVTKSTKTAMLQGGYDPERWPYVERDWFSPRFSFIMHGQLAQPLDCKVLTPSGWSKIGEIEPGDVILNPEGGLQVVESLSDIAFEKVYKVTLSDGSVTRASGSHLWKVDRKKTKGNHRNLETFKSNRFHDEWEVLSTESLLNLGVHTGNHFRFRLPIPEVDLPTARTPVDPYLLGALLGDGCFTGNSIEFTCIEDCLISELKEVLPKGVSLSQKANRKNWNLIGRQGKFSILKSLLLEVGIGENCKTPNKFVPEVYLGASSEQRLALLQGLMDTDGWNMKTPGAAGFSSSSYMLVQAVQFLVRSLGGNAKISKAKIPSYTYRGQIKQGFPHWEVHIYSSFNPFRMSRKKEAWSANSSNIRKSSKLSDKTIVSVEEVGYDYVRCLRVSGESKTYITDDFIVTHNSLRKDPHVAIQAYIELKEEYPDEFEPAEMHVHNTDPGLPKIMETVIPKFRIHYETWPEDVVRQFYQSGHVLISPSHGEGKNLPCLEMLSTGGSVIATSYSGHLNWLSDAYAYPLNHKVVPVHEAKYGPDCQWAAADKEHLKAQMLHAFRNRAEVKNKGELGAQLIPQMCSWDRVVEDLFRIIADKFPEKGAELRYRFNEVKKQMESRNGR